MKKIIEFIASGFYSGFLPYAPGTWGTLAAFFISAIIGFLFEKETQIIFIFITLSVFVLGVIVSAEAEKESREHDPAWIVIDEFAGSFAVFCFVPVSYLSLSVGFLFFRIFDIYKPWPINLSQNLHGGWGIMTDDILAGIYAGTVLLMLNRSINILYL